MRMLEHVSDLVDAGEGNFGRLQLPAQAADIEPTEAVRHRTIRLGAVGEAGRTAWQSADRRRVRDRSSTLLHSATHSRSF